MDSNCGGPKEFPASVLVNAIFKSSRSFQVGFLNGEHVRAFLDQLFLQFENLNLHVPFLFGEFVRSPASFLEEISVPS